MIPTFVIHGDDENAVEQETQSRKHFFRIMHHPMIRYYSTTRYLMAVQYMLAPHNLIRAII